MDNVLMSQDPPGATAVCLCHSPLSSLSPPPVSPSITLACLLSFHLVSCTCHTFPPVSSPLFSSPLSNLLFPLMDISNVHHYARLGGDSFLQLLTGKALWDYSLIDYISESKLYSLIHPSFCSSPYHRTNCALHHCSIQSISLSIHQSVQLLIYSIWNHYH